MARRIIQTCKTNNPFEIADMYNINIFEKPLPSHIGGFYTEIFGYAYIVINSLKLREWRKAICAHELGHALLHNQEHTFIAMNDFATESKLEKEANMFAAKLLIGDEKPLEGESIYEFAKRVRVPVEFIMHLKKEEFM